MADDFNNSIKGMQVSVLEGDQLYFTGANKGESVQNIKNYDANDEKVSEEQIREIPRYDVVARHKTRKEYNDYISGFKYLKKRIEKNSKKLLDINDTLEKHATYPDEAFGRDKLLREKYKLEQEINEWNNTIQSVSKEKIRIYGKALGLPRKPDSFFEVIPSSKKSMTSIAKQVEEFNKKETEEAKKKTQKEEDIELDPLKDANEIYEEVKTEKEQINEEVEKALEKQEKVSLSMDEQLYNLYVKFEKKYGKDNVEKYFTKALYSVLYDKNEEKKETSTIVSYDTAIKSDAELIYENAELNAMLNDNNSVNNMVERNK